MSSKGVARKKTRCWVRATDFSCPQRTTLEWAPRTVTSACTSQRHTPLQLGICFEPRICERAVPNGVFDSGVWSEGNNFNFHTSVPARLFAPEGCGAGGPPSLTMRGVSPATPPPLSAIKVKAASYVACFVLRSTLTAVRALAHTCELAHTHTLLKFLCGHKKSVTLRPHTVVHSVATPLSRCPERGECTLYVDQTGLDFDCQQIPRHWTVGESLVGQQYACLQCAISLSL